MASEPSAVRELAERAGILPAYLDIHGERRECSDETREALLAAMDLDASSEAAAARSLADLEATGSELLRPVTVLSRVRGKPGLLSFTVPSRPGGTRYDYSLELVEENGRVRRVEGARRFSARHRSASVPLPADLEDGYHRANLRLQIGGDEVRGDTSLIVCPRSCLTVEEALPNGAGFGIWSHLYCVRSERNFGVGDVGDLQRLADWSAARGAAFFGLNPLHALRNRGDDISPYSPVSRLYRNVLYIDLTRVPELAGCEDARGLMESPAYVEALAELRAADRVDYERVMALKGPVLEALHRAFTERHVSRTDGRGRDYAEYLERRGESLQRFATFVALDRHFAERGEHDWHRWPDEFRDPDSPAVTAFRREHLEEVDRYRYLQFELDRQLGEVATTARLPIGLYGDLAIGTAGNGADPWAFPGLFVDGVSVGAPPDDYSLEGQDWGFPPMDPRRLAADGYRYWISLLRNALEHLGALRIDHVMGLFRQYWVPAGRTATEGAYVRYPSDDLLGILALESRRNQALIVGEDLGTVPRALPATLARWGILSSRVMYFERDRRGEYRPARRYSRRALVTADTHDHPPLRGFWEERDLELRHRTGSLSSEELARARGERERERGALLRRLRREGCLQKTDDPEPYPELCSAVHSYLAKTPAPLVGVWLDDLVGEPDPLNLPGIGLDRYPSWSRRPAMSVETLVESSDVDRALGRVAQRPAPA